MALMNLSQGRKRDADVESGPVDTAGGGEGGVRGKQGTGVYPPPRASHRLLKGV